MSLDPIEHDGIVVRPAPERDRYELVDPERTGNDEDGSVIGHLDYHDVEPDGSSSAQRDFVRTEVDEDYGGRGLASVLVEFALDDVRAAGMRIVPHCSYVASWIRKHEGRFDDLVDWPA